VRRLARTFVILTTLMLFWAVPAFADNPGFSRDPGGISITVSQLGGPGAYAEASGGSGIQCKYVKESLPTDGDTSHQGEAGQWYAYVCGDGLNLWLGNLWVPATQPAVAPAVLAQTAWRYLRLPPPGIQTSPDVAADQIVNVPTWLWVDPATWGPRSATASVPNESATATAVPVTVTWTMGDGSQVVCRGPGTPYTEGDPARPSPTCSHTYPRSSARQPGLRYPVTATTTWRITWTATGVVSASGTLPPLLRTSTTTLRVAESQTVN
jgi:hypothetical protein